MAVSLYRHLASTTAVEGGFEAFFERFLAGRLDDGSWFVHVRGWRVNKEGLDVLYVAYDALLEDFDRTVAEIARFCGVEVSAETMARVRERCSLDFMKKHEGKLDPERAYFGGRGIVFSNFVREGKTDAWRAGLSERQKQVYRERFQRVLGGRGLDRYLPS